MLFLKTLTHRSDGLSLMEPVRSLQILAQRAWELHDSISNEIQFSFVDSGGSLRPKHPHRYAYAGSREDPFVAERRSLIAIREAIGVLHNAILSLQKLQSQQRIEREAALMRLEESRLVLQESIAEYPGSAPNVIQEMLKFVNYKENAFDINLEYSPKNDNDLQNTGDVHGGEKRCIFLGFFGSCIRVFSNLWKLQNAGVLGRLVVVAASLLSAIHLYRTKDCYFERKEGSMQRTGLSDGRQEHPFSKASSVGEFGLLHIFSNEPSDVFYGRG